MCSVKIHDLQIYQNSWLGGLSDIQKQAAINLNRKQRENYFVTDVMRYIDEHSTDAYVDAVLRDIRMTYELLDWEKLDRLCSRNLPL